MNWKLIATAAAVTYAGLYLYHDGKLPGLKDAKTVKTASK